MQKQIFVLTEQVGSTSIGPEIAMAVEDKTEAETWKKSLPGRDFKQVVVVEKVNYDCRQK